jgi:hypothetical protein
MAVVKTSAFVDGFKGKIGGDVYQYNAGGLINRTGKVIQRSSLYSPQFQRNSFAAIAQAWRGLTALQRNAWSVAAATVTAYTRFGEPRTMSGYQFYAQSCAHMVCFGYPVLSDYVTGTNPSPPAGVSFSSSLWNSIIIQFPFPSVGTIAQLIEVTPVNSPGKTYQSGKWRCISYGLGSGGASVDITDAYQTNFGVAPIGWALWVQCWLLDTATGLVSPKVRISTLIAAI